MSDLAGKVALVSGAAHGQGRSHAVRLGAEGADVIAIDVCGPAADVGYAFGTSAELEETRRLVEATGRRCHTAEADVRDRDALARISAECEAEFPRLDVIVANAAISACAPALTFPPERWDEIIDINLTGAWNLIRAFAPRMVAAGNGGSIVLIGSVSGLKAVPYCAPYVAAKHGLHGLMKVLAVELGGDAIRVNTIDPGAVATPMTTDESFLQVSREDPEAASLFGASFSAVMPMPEGGFMQPGEISDAVAWLASDHSRFVTGASIPVDAGVTVR